MNILREYGISFEDWGETFKLDKDKRFELAHYAESLLKDPRFEALLSEMEFNVLSEIRRMPLTDDELLKGMKVQLIAVRQLRNMFHMLSSDIKLAESGK